MKTSNIDALTNSAVMVLAKEMAKNGIDLYRVDRNDMLRNMLRGFIASAKADSLNERVVERAQAAFPLAA